MGAAGWREQGELPEKALSVPASLRRSCRRLRSFDPVFKKYEVKRSQPSAAPAGGMEGNCAATGGPYGFFSRFRAIKLTKWVAGGGYFPVSVLVLPGLARSHCVKPAVSFCQVEPNPDFGIYNPDPVVIGRGCQIQKIGLDG